MTDMTGSGEEWLKRNHSLRMDANSALFPAERREFHLDRYEFAKEYCRDKRVLDGACGTGYGSSILGTVASEVVGIDCAQDTVTYATKNYSTTNVSFQRSFVELTPFEPSSFDVVVSFETVEHTLCPGAHIMEIARILKPDGMAILSVPNKWGFTDHHFFDFDLPLLRRITDTYFGQAEFFYQNPRSRPSLPGIGPLVSDEPSQAQCILAVCSDPRKENIIGERLDALMDEIYKSAFSRHNEFLTLSYRQNTSLARRAINKLRSMLR